MTNPDNPQSAPAAWGRVDDDGIVYVRDTDGERAVGSYPGASSDEALAYYERKFADLEAQVALLEQRVKHGAPGKDVKQAVSRLQDSLREPSAVGDLNALRDRVTKLHDSAQELTEKQGQEAKKAVEASIGERTRIVEGVEKIAAKDPQKIQWKQASADIERLFSTWQERRQSDPRIPSAAANALWERLRAARALFERNRRHFFAELEVTHTQVRTRKEALIAKAEALAPKGAAAIPAYRDLLETWKKAGNAGKRHEDQLWARFKKAGDVLYSDKSAIDALENEEWQANLHKKMELLTEAEPLLTATDRESARQTLRSIQRRWDEIGKVPRDKVRPVEDRLRKVEDAVRRLDDQHWRNYNPEKKARSEGLAAQLHDAISVLETELAEAKDAGDGRKASELETALAARRLWLETIEK